VDLHGERMVVDDNDNDDDQEDDDKTLEYLSQISNELADQMDRQFGNEQGGDFGNEQGGDDAGGADNDGEARVGDADDGDNLEEMLRVIALEILLKSKKGLENLDRTKKSIKEDCVWC
jgi:hypothetical protein